MRTWARALGALCGGLVSLAVLLTPAHAQFSSGPGPGPGHPPEEKHSPFSVKDDGLPNAFSSKYDLRPRYNHGTILPSWLRYNLQHLRPGIFHPAPTLAVPAEFPEPARPGCEEASPWTIREEGIANGFTNLEDPNPHWRPLAHLFHGTRLLYSELLEPAPKVAECHVVNFRYEYLAWRVSPGTTSSALVTTNTGPSFTSFGQLGDPGTVVLVPAGAPIDYGNLEGFRLTAGLAIGYIPPVEVSGFLINRKQTVFSEGSLTNPPRLLAIPFQDVQPSFLVPGTNIGIETAAIIALPIGSGVGALGGTLDITSQLSFWGIEANTFIPFAESDYLKLEGIIGYRHVHLDERLTISTQSGGQVGGIFFNGVGFPLGQFSVSTIDTFLASNSFDGFQLGLRGIATTGRWSIYSDSKVAFGRSTHQVDIGGSSTLIQSLAGRPTQSTAGGILALPSNSGTLTLSVPSAVLDFNVALNFQVNETIRVFGGYNYMYWSTVARPGDYIDNLIDSRQIPTSFNFVPGSRFTSPSLPSSIVRREFTAQGLFFGIEIGF